MSSRSFLLVLLVLACLQSITTARNTNAPRVCCFKFQMSKLPIHDITAYKRTRHDCPKAGIIFIMKSGSQVCADPSVQWVKEHMDKIDT